MAKKQYIIGTDTGGTFTDIVVLDNDGNVIVNKSPTTPDDFSEGVMNSIDVIVDDMGISKEELLRHGIMFKHGTTVGTNALITMTGPRVGFITTKGFEDTTLIMRAIGRVDGLDAEKIKHMAAVTKPEPIVTKTRIRGVRERVDYAGRVVVPINEADIRIALKSLIEDEKIEAIAVSFLFGWVNPVHEQKVKEIARQMYPDTEIYYSYAHELVPVVREYARANTVIINCFLGSTMNSYVSKIESELNENGYQQPMLIMQANGGVVNRNEMKPISTVASGPAGGVIGGKYFADILGHKNVITTDMGGTSFDVSLICDGFWQFAREPVISRFRVIQPMIDIESIGSGGGTIARVDPDTDRLLLGPQSAGANPGPVCYDMGGTEPTVTDADLVLNLLDPDYFLGGRQKLNRQKAEAAIVKKIAEPLGLSLIKAAAGIHDIVNSYMSDLIRKQLVKAGQIPEGFVIYAFGGAGPVHCAAYASELGVPEVYVFPSSAVFSAFGIASSDVIHTRVSSHRYFMPVEPDALNTHIQNIEAELILEMKREDFQEDQIEFRHTFFLRYRRQMNELGVVVPTRQYDAEGIQDVIDLFEKKYDEVYGEGSSYPEAGIELISTHIDAICKTTKPKLKTYPQAKDDPAGALKGEREVYFAGKKQQYLKTNIYDYAKLTPGNKFNGPAIIETPVTTVIIPPDRSAQVDSYLNISIKV
ncbi:hydantoinase/oxoprolinase family protein [Thermodesulfobacteriota bacterium]